MASNPVQQHRHPHRRENLKSRTEQSYYIGYIAADTLSRTFAKCTNLKNTNNGKSVCTPLFT
jgi:hypothetical protein